MKTRPFSPSVIALVAAAALLVLVPLTLPAAQDDTDAKIRLQAEALRARDAGDLAAAQAALAQLVKLAPNDEKVKRLAAEIETQAAVQRAALEQRAAQQRAAEQAAADAAQRAALERAAAARTADGGRRTADNAAPTVSVSLPPSAVSPPPSGSAAGMVDVKIPEPGQQPAAITPPQPSPAELEAEALARAETQRLTIAMANAQTALANARGQIREGHPGDAIVTVDNALAALPANPLTQKLIADLTREKATALLEQAQVLLKRGDTEGARAVLAAHNQLAPGSTRAASIERQLARNEDKAAEAASRPGVDPAFTAERQITAQLIAKGRAQYVAGDIDGAQQTFREVEAKEPDNTTAKGFLLRIAQEKADSGLLNREKTRAQLLEEVAKAWQRPGIYQERTREQDHGAAAAPLLKKLNDIILPNVSFTRADIGQAVVTLSAASEEFDNTGIGPKGVNVVLLDPSNKNPQVTITLRNTSLKRVLDFITEGIGYQYEVQADAVVVRPGGETSNLETAFFPITRATVLRMTGISALPAAATAGAKDPYATGDGVNTTGEAGSMRNFLQQAGVSFNVEGSSLAYDGSAIIVTQTARNIERIRNILARYNDVRQVEIESKFMEVREGVLEELGVTWTMTRRGIPQINPATGAPVLDANGRQVFLPQEVYGTDTVNRSLTGAFTPVNSVQGINIVGGGTTVATTGTTGTTTTTTSSSSANVPMNAPVIPGGVNVGTGVTPLAAIKGFVGEFDVNAIIRALSQKQGTDLLSSPKITVLSGNPANITVAQELRYPQSYGEIQSQVSGGTGGTGVTITAGTPQEFTMRNVGVELKVTPTVEEDDYSISLDLNPKVTEFEGFVEYGGPSVAISGGTSVTVPPGFYQPIFSVRDISTKVTIWDGATLVMGGLTREEVKKVNDKVPFFGDIPLLGRLFRSKGESAQKRNLLIFVTANLVSPGGSPKKQSLKSTPANSLFQNPTIVTPASSEPRTRSGDK